jgi:hypothetical protein
MRSAPRIGVAAVVGVLALVGTAAAHDILDHPAPTFAPQGPASSTRVSGGEGAKWELVTSIVTGNPHSDLDFFTHGGETYASVGTLGSGPNAGGQTIVKLTQGGEVKPSYVTGHPSAACPTTAGATALQHDVEAAPKGDVIFNGPNPHAVRSDAQLLVDTTDGSGRCHDSGLFGQQAPQGGLEIIDVTDPAKPKELALISHIGNAHTTNVDPKRPHIAFDVTQDGVTIGSDGKRTNENEMPLNNALDGFEVIDMSSCMNFPAGTTLQQKRDACRPEVYRYRYPSADFARSHTFRNALQSCHEVEVYPDDKLACASITATILFDLGGAFDDRGTPTDFADDKPRGTPLPCRVRNSTSPGAFTTGAKVIDCADTDPATAGNELRVATWLKMGAPSLEGVKRIGTAHHMGFGATQDIANNPYDSTQDIVAAHESELTESGRFILTTDERGGGVVPGGATCSPGADNVRGNGGIHAYAVDRLDTAFPATAEEAWDAYARTVDGKKSIYRARIRTGPQGSFCTAHVFQQIPGQNRIFMGWYTQGTQVVDFGENPDGTFEFKEAGWFTPENANTWTSAIFKVQQNADGSFTYWGATGDGIVPGSGRSAIDVYKATLPPPPVPGKPLSSALAPTAAARCLARRARIGRRGIGRVRVGDSRRRMIRRAGLPVRESRRLFRYCVENDRRARVVAVFDRRGRARLVGTNARGHRLRGIGPGSPARRLRSRGARRFGRGVFVRRADRRRRVVFGTRRARVRYVAVVDRSLTRSRRVLNRYLRDSGLR